MAGDDNQDDAQAHNQPPQPNPALNSLDVMVGTWELKGRESGPMGEIHGRPAFEWMEGGFYLVQHIHIDYIGRRIVGTEYVGYDEENDGLQLVVRDIRAARAQLVERGVDVSEVQVVGPSGPRPARDGDELDNIGFVFFDDPDGNGWAVQQISARD